MFSHGELLPDEVIHNLCLYFDLKDIFNLSLVSKRFCLLLDSNSFWKDKCTKDFDRSIGEPPWKEVYKSLIYGDVFVFGLNRCGEVGLPSVDHFIQDTPFQVPNLKARNAAVGPGYTLILDFQGNLHVTGHDVPKMLSLDYGPCKFVMVEGIKGKAVFTQGYSSFLIDPDDNVLAFGENEEGRLGLSEDFIPLPRRIEGLKAKDISIGSNFTAVIDLNDNVQILRNGECVPLGVRAKGLSTHKDLLVTVDLEGKIQAFRIGGKEVKAISLETPLPEVKAKSVIVEEYRTIVLDLESNVWISRKNSLERLPIKALKVVSDYSSIMLIAPDHSVWGFGPNTAGMLGLPWRVYCRRPTQLVGLRAAHIFMRDCHTVVIGKKVPVSLYETFSDLASKMFHFM